MGEGGSRQGATSPDQAQTESLEIWFGSRADEWRDSYRSAKRVNDLVLVDRLNIALAGVRKQVPAGGHILDAGCGAGWASLELARSGYSVHGVDLAQEMIEQCERTLSENGIDADRYTFTRGELLSTELAAQSFHGIVALGVLQYQLDEARLLARFHDLLRPGGVLVITGPVRRSIPNLFGAVAAAGSLLRRLRVLGKRPPAGTAQHRYSLGRIRRLLDEAGFEPLAERGHGFGDWVVIGRLIGFRGELMLHRLFSRLARLLPIGRWGNDLVVTARKRS